MTFLFGPGPIPFKKKFEGGWARASESRTFGTGRHDWATRLGEKTGRHDWAKRLGDTTGRHDWAKRLGDTSGDQEGDQTEDEKMTEIHRVIFFDSSPPPYILYLCTRGPPPTFFLDFRAPSILQVELSGTSKSPGWPRWSCRESHFLASPTTQWTKYWEKMTRFWQMDLSGMPKFRTRFFTESRKFPWSFFSPCVYRGSAGEFECHVDKALA